MSEPTYDLLAEVVDGATYRQGWTLGLGVNEDGDRELHVIVHGADSYHPDRTRGTRHIRLVPAASYNRRTWVRWVFDFVCAVEVHEACEFFEVFGVKPFAPHHGAGEDPYTVHERSQMEVTTDDARVHPGEDLADALARDPTLVRPARP